MISLDKDFIEDDRLKRSKNKCEIDAWQQVHSSLDTNKSYKMTIDSQGGGSEWLIRGNPTKAVHESERLKSRHKDTQRIHVLVHVTNLVPRAAIFLVSTKKLRPALVTAVILSTHVQCVQWNWKHDVLVQVFDLVRGVVRLVSFDQNGGNSGDEIGKSTEVNEMHTSLTFL